MSLHSRTTCKKCRINRVAVHIFTSRTGKLKSALCQMCAITYYSNKGKLTPGLKALLKYKRRYIISVNG